MWGMYTTRSGTLLHRPWGIALASHKAGQQQYWITSLLCCTFTELYSLPLPLVSSHPHPVTLLSILAVH